MSMARLHCFFNLYDFNTTFCLLVALVQPYNCAYLRQSNFLASEDPLIIYLWLLVFQASRALGFLILLEIAATLPTLIAYFSARDQLIWCLCYLRCYY